MKTVSLPGLISPRTFTSQAIYLMRNRFKMCRVDATAVDAVNASHARIVNIVASVVNFKASRNRPISQNIGELMRANRLACPKTSIAESSWAASPQPALPSLVDLAPESFFWCTWMLHVLVGHKANYSTLHRWA